jgi:hypothetical protein
MDDDEEFSSPSAARGKRGLNGGEKKSYAELDSEEETKEEYVPMNKRVKMEPIEDEAVFNDDLDDEI